MVRAVQQKVQLALVDRKNCATSNAGLTPSAVNTCSEMDGLNKIGEDQEPPLTLQKRSDFSYYLTTLCTRNRENED